MSFTHMHFVPNKVFFFFFCIFNFSKTISIYTIFSAHVLRSSVFSINFSSFVFTILCDNCHAII